MALFSKKLDSIRLGKRLEDLRAQLSMAEAAVEARLEDLGAASTEGKPIEKALADLATARGKVEALQHSVISRAEAELAEVEAREEAARRLAEHEAMVRRWEALTAKMKERRAAYEAAKAKAEEAKRACSALLPEYAVFAGDLDLTSIGSLLGSVVENASDLHAYEFRISGALGVAQREG